MNTIIIGEIGLNHNGDTSIVKQLIDICSDLNIPYIKFQKRDIDSCYTKEFLDGYRDSPWGNTQRDQKKGIEFNLEQYKEIDFYCQLRGIKWFASPWDLKSIDFLKDNFPNMPFLKIPSAKITDKLFLRRCDDTKFPLIMSTGMSNLEMIRGALLIAKNTQYLLGCTSSYPCPNKDTNLKQIHLLKHYFETDSRSTGWSDHSGGILFPSTSVVLGAKMVEVHITWDRKMYGSDQASSLEPGGLRKLVKYINALEEGLGNPVKEIMLSEIPIIKKLRGD